eukprot:Nk52_evm22s2630 gene=Nk52_evmTU22s2630
MNSQSRTVSSLYRKALKLIPKYVRQQQVRDFYKILIIRELNRTASSSSSNPYNNPNQKPMEQPVNINNLSFLANANNKRSILAATAPSSTSASSSSASASSRLKHHSVSSVSPSPAPPSSSSASFSPASSSPCCTTSIGRDGEFDLESLLSHLDKNDSCIQTYCRKHIRDMFMIPLEESILGNENVSNEDAAGLSGEDALNHRLEKGFTQLERVIELLDNQKCTKLFDHVPEGFNLRSPRDQHCQNRP